MKAQAASSPARTLHVQALALQGLSPTAPQSVQVRAGQVCAGVPVAQQLEAGAAWPGHQAAVRPRQVGQRKVLDRVRAGAVQRDALPLSQLVVHLWTRGQGGFVK